MQPKKQTTDSIHNDWPLHNIYNKKEKQQKSNKKMFNEKCLKD